MSNMYITEPNTEGKVLLHTSFGDIDVELWPQQAPKACRNFVQLSLEGYYDNTIFHRIVADFIVQGGDPSGTGDGGESIYGQPFVDEFHSRLKFNHRGLLAMANENKPNSNHSQFFFTLDACEFLNKKHTIFGKITGNTIFNLLSVGSTETDAKDRPLNPPKLRSVEVLWNPFDDIVPRATAKKELTNEEAKEKKKKERKATKDLKLLSFGDDEDAMEDFAKPPSKRKKMMSSHDLLDDKKLKKEAIAIQERKDNGRKEEATKKLKAAVAAASQPTEKTPAPIPEPVKPKPVKQKEADEYKQLREELKKGKKAVPVILGSRAREHETAKAYHDMLTPLQQQRAKYLERKRATSRAARQEETMAKLHQFKQTLAGAKAGETQEKKEQESYHGQVIEDEEDEDDSSWMTAKLKFKKHIDDQYREGKGPSADDYVTIDPREDMKRRRHD